MSHNRGNVVQRTRGNVVIVNGRGGGGFGLGFGIGLLVFIGFVLLLIGLGLLWWFWSHRKPPIPAFSPSPGIYAVSQRVAITDSMAGVSIHYTTDGTPPSTSSPVYHSPVTVRVSLTIQAIAATDMEISEVATGTYEIRQPVVVAAPPPPPPPITATPAISPDPGRYYGPQTVTISDDMADAIIYFTVDGTRPGAWSKSYSKPIQVETSKTIRAIALAPGHAISKICSAEFTIIPTQATKPLFLLRADTYAVPQSVGLSTETPGATIYYTTDGTPPGKHSARYSGPISVEHSETIRAIAVAPGYAPSEMESATYTIASTASAAPPFFSPPPGTYTTQQLVTISDDTPGAAIHYTTDGTTPTLHSRLYTSAIEVAMSQTIKAIAIAPGYSTSSPGSASYTIEQSRHVMVYIERTGTKEALDVLDAVPASCLAGTSFAAAQDRGSAGVIISYDGPLNQRNLKFSITNRRDGKVSYAYAPREIVNNVLRVKPEEGADEICSKLNEYAGR